MKNAKSYKIKKGVMNDGVVFVVECSGEQELTVAKLVFDNADLNMVLALLIIGELTRVNK